MKKQFEFDVIYTLFLHADRYGLTFLLYIIHVSSKVKMLSVVYPAADVTSEVCSGGHLTALLNFVFIAWSAANQVAS